MQTEHRGSGGKVVEVTTASVNGVRPLLLHSAARQFKDTFCLLVILTTTYQVFSMFFIHTISVADKLDEIIFPLLFPVLLQRPCNAKHTLINRVSVQI